MKTRPASMLLLLTSLIWGFSFVAQSVASGSLDPFTFNAIRFLLGALVLVPFALPGIRRIRSDSEYRRKYIKGAVLCGLFLALASLTQQKGVAISGAAKGGFLTSLYIILVPFLSVLLGGKVGLRTWASGVVALAGMYMLTLGGSKARISEGDIWLLVCAFLFAGHIIVIDRTGKGLDGISLSMGQFLTAGIISLPGLFVEGPMLSDVLSQAVPVFYAGAFSCGIAYTLQVVGQKYVEPPKATLIMSLESVWAAVGGALILSERLTGLETAGCVLVFVSVLFAQLNPSSK